MPNKLRVDDLLYKAMGMPMQNDTQNDTEMDQSRKLMQKSSRSSKAVQMDQLARVLRLKRLH